MAILYQARVAILRRYEKAMTWTHQHERTVLLGAFTVALLIRVLYLTLFVGLNTPPQYDGIGYDLLASRLLEGKGYINDWAEPTAFRPPVYPMFLAGVYLLTNHSFGAVRALQAVLDSFTVMFVFLIARELANKRVALLAATGAAIYPLLIFETGEMYPETLSFFLQFATVWCLVLMLRMDHLVLPLAAGVMMGLTVLARPTAAPWVLLVLVWAIVPSVLHSPVQKLAAMLLGLMVVFGPWTIRNYNAFKEFIPISSLGTIGLWSGNNPLAQGGGVMPTPQTWNGDDYPERGWYGWEGISEMESGRRFAAKALQWIRDNPFGFVRLIPLKLLYLWSPVSYSTQFGRQAPAVLVALALPPYLVFLVFAGVGIFIVRKAWKQIFPLLAVIISINMLAIIYVGATRYGIPMGVSLVIFAAISVDHLFYHSIQAAP